MAWASSRRPSEPWRASEPGGGRPVSPVDGASVSPVDGTPVSPGDGALVSRVDTVGRAAATPGQPQPHAELGLTDAEYARIRELLGRRPTDSELAIYSVVWSEDCSYKSSKAH